MPGTLGALSSHFEVHSDGTKLRFALLKKNGRKGMRHDRPIEKGAGSCELTEKLSTGGRNILSKRPTKRPPMATPLYYIYKLCRCTRSSGNNCLYGEDGKHVITIIRNPSCPI